MCLTVNKSTHDNKRGLREAPGIPNWREIKVSDLGFHKQQVRLQEIWNFPLPCFLTYQTCSVSQISKRTTYNSLPQFCWAALDPGPRPPSKSLVLKLDQLWRVHPAFANAQRVKQRVRIQPLSPEHDWEKMPHGGIERPDSRQLTWSFKCSSENRIPPIFPCFIMLYHLPC